jgi:hypothetical protein
MGATALINKDREGGCVLGSGTMRAARYLSPERRIDDREHRVPFGPQMNMGDDQAIGLPERSRLWEPNPNRHFIYLCFLAVYAR